MKRLLPFLMPLIMAALFPAAKARADETVYVTPNIIRTTGTTPYFSSADDSVSSTSVPIGFNFVYGGTTYNQVWMSTNGILFFNAGTSEYTNADLSTMTAYPGVYALWDDLYVGPSGNPDLSSALYYTAGTAGSRVFIMQWTNWYSYNEPYEVGTFNVVLHEGSNKIDIYYRNMLGTSTQRQYGTSSTIGLVAPGNYSSQWSFNTPNATQGKFLTYTPTGAGNTPYSLQVQTVSAATTASIGTYFLQYTSAPQVPVNLSASPQNPNSTSATLTWDLAALGSAPTSYVIRYATNPQFTNLVQTSSFTTAGSYVLTGLTAGATYYWQVVSSANSLTSISTSSSFVQLVNHAPVAAAGTLTTTANTPASGTLAATDIDNNPQTSGLIYSVGTQPTNGHVTINNSSTGAYTYTPNNGFSGSDPFTFLAYDGTTYSAAATITVTVGSPSPIIGVQQPAGTGLSFSPAATRDFGTVGLLSTVSSKTFTIANTGTVSLTSTGIVIGGTNAADFTVTASPAFPVAASGSTTFTVTFSPSAAGSRTATLSIPSNDSSHTPFVVNLTGTGDSSVATLITSAGANAYAAPSTPVVVDSSLIVTGTGTITGATVSITGGFASGDVLADTDQLGITGSYNSTTGILTLSGSASASDYQTVLRTVTLGSSSTSTAQRTITFSIGQSLINPNNNHFYEFVSAPGITWLDAKTAAAGRSLYGMQGYLVTVTSAAENSFVASKLQGQGWMGASDDSSQGTSEGQWIWATGPEAGTLFWTGQGSSGSAVGGRYNNWNSGEPNNLGGENFAHFLGTGQWNDYPNNAGSSIQGYVVEYGGLGSDPLLQLSSAKLVNVTYVAPQIALEQPAGTGLSFSPAATVSFGTAGLLSTVSTRTFTLKNTGTAALTSTGLTLSGANAGDFSLTASPAFPVAVSGSTTFTITFSPTVAGSRSATLNIPSDDTTHTPFVVNLSGTGSNTVPTLVPSAGSGSYSITNPAVAVDSSLQLTGSGTLTGATVSITGGFIQGADVLSFTNQLGITGSYNATTGILTLTGSASYADYQTALRSVTFNTTAGIGSRTFTFAVGQGVFNPANNHSYEFVSAPGITWQAAQAAAAARSLYGMQGYLVTVTSAAENAFVSSKLQGQGWMGASDDSGQGTSEGQWKWVTGPEAGTLFWTGLGNSGGSAVNGLYNNWASGEPNNAGTENFAHFLANGQWNDYAYNNSNIQGYVVEYGGLGTDPQLQLSGPKTFAVLAPPPTVTTLAACDVTMVSATLVGRVNANGADTTCSFEWGPTTAYGYTVAASPGTATGVGNTSVSAGIPGLSLCTIYHYRAKGVSGSGTVYGADMTFTTAGTITSGNDNAQGVTPGGASIGHWGSVRSGMVISETGAVAYRGFLSLGGSVDANNFQGIWKSEDGTAAGVYLLARAGDSAPDTGSGTTPVNALFDTLPYNPVINNLGQTSFVGFLRVGTGNAPTTTSSYSGLWSELGGTGLHKILRQGETVTGGTVTAIAPSAWVATSDAGHLAFNVKIGSTSSGLIRAAVTPGTLTLATLAQQGGAAPDVGGGTQGTFDTFLGNTSDPRIDVDGNVAFLNTVLPGGTGIWYQSVAGSLTAVARSGQAAPGVAGDSFTGFERPTLSVGSIAFRAFLANNGQSVWRGNPATPSSITCIAKQGDTGLPGMPAGRKLWSLWSPYSNALGQVAFRATMVDTATNANEIRAIVTDTSGTLSIIAKAGDSAPGWAGETFTSFDHPVIGDGAQVAFMASTSGGHVGLWRQAANGGALTLVLSMGDTINTGNGPETVAQIILPGGSTADRMNEVHSLSANGRILVHLTYVSGSTGMLLTPY